MLIKFFIPVLLGMPVLAVAQKAVAPEFYTENARGITDVFNSGFDIVSYDLRDTGIQGNPMLAPTWMMGDVLLIGNQKPVAVVVKYDIYRQQLRVRRPQGDSIIVPVTRIKEFTLTGLTSKGMVQKRQFVHYENAALATELNGTCAEILSSSKQLQLLKFWRKTIVKVAENSTNMALPSTSRNFHEVNKYYLRWVADGRMVAVRLKRGSLKEALADQPEALKELDVRKSNLNSEEELIAALNAIDPLLIPPSR